MYRYYAIRSDDRCSQLADTGDLVDFLSSLDELRSTGPGQFANSGNFPRCQVVLVGKAPLGKYDAPRQVSTVELICTSAEVGELDKRYEQLGITVARHLGWELIVHPEDQKIWP